MLSDRQSRRDCQGTASAFGFVEPDDDRAAVFGNFYRLKDRAGAVRKEERVRGRQRTAGWLWLANEEWNVQGKGLVDHLAQCARVRQSE